MARSAEYPQFYAKRPDQQLGLFLINYVTNRSNGHGWMFDVFPDSSELPDTDGVGNLFDSIRTAALTGETRVMTGSATTCEPPMDVS